MLDDILRNVGLSDKEIVVYLAMLRLGPQPASIIARSTGINRSTAYSILDTLFKKGLLSQLVKKEVKFFSVISPENLVSYVSRIISDLQRNRAELVNMIPEFMALSNPLGAKPKVLFFEGLQGLKEILDQMDNIDGRPLIISGYERNCMNSFSTGGYSDILEEFKDMRSSRMLLFAHEKNKSAARRHFARETPGFLKRLKIEINNTFPQEMEMYFYQKKAVFAIYHQKNVIGLLLEDVSVLSALKAIFESLWKK